MLAGDSAKPRASCVSDMCEGQEDMDIGRLRRVVDGYCAVLSFLRVIHFYGQFVLLSFMRPEAIRYISQGISARNV